MYRVLQTTRENIQKRIEYALFVLKRGHVVFGPIHHDRLQERKVVADLADFHRRFAALAHTHLGLRMSEYIFAGLGRVRRIDSSSNAVSHPGALEGEIVLRRVEADHRANVLLL